MTWDVEETEEVAEQIVEVPTEVSEIKLFDRYSYLDVVCKDVSLRKYINLSVHTIMPHTANRNNVKKFGKAKTSIVERFACQLMRRGRNNGKKRLACKALESAFIIMHLITGQNPIQLLVDALINAGPREDSARIGRGGNMKRTSVDVSPLRRLNLAIFNITKGVRTAARKSLKTLPELLAEEIMNAAKNSPNSYSIKKKDETERVAKSNR